MTFNIVTPRPDIDGRLVQPKKQVHLSQQNAYQNVGSSVDERVNAHNQTILQPPKQFLSERNAHQNTDQVGVRTDVERLFTAVERLFTAHSQPVQNASTHQQSRVPQVPERYKHQSKYQVFSITDQERLLLLNPSPRQQIGQPQVQQSFGQQVHSQVFVPTNSSASSVVRDTFSSNHQPMSTQVQQPLNYNLPSHVHVPTTNSRNVSLTPNQSTYAARRSSQGEPSLIGLFLSVMCICAAVALAIFVSAVNAKQRPYPPYKY